MKKHAPNNVHVMLEYYEALATFVYNPPMIIVNIII